LIVRRRQMDTADIHVLDRSGQPLADLPVDSKAGLMGVWVLVVPTGMKQDSQRRARACLTHVDAELLQVGSKNRALRSWDTDNALIMQRCKDVDGSVYG